MIFPDFCHSKIKFGRIAERFWRIAGETVRREGVGSAKLFAIEPAP